MSGRIAIDSKVRIKDGQYAGKDGLVRQSNIAKSRVSFFLIGMMREQWFDNAALEIVEGRYESRAELLAQRIIDGILVHGFENDPDAEKVLRAQQPLVVAALNAEMGG